MSESKPAHRAWQLLLIVGTIGFSWLALQAVHEMGHVLHARLSGGTVNEVVLRPTTLSQTVVDPNPHPCFVAWGGPIWGCLIPLAMWAVVWLVAHRYAFLAQFFAGACLVANGTYLGTSVIIGGRHLDGPVILAQGGSAWQVLLFSIVAMAAGLYLWNGLGPHFGLGKSTNQVDHRATFVIVVLLILVVILEYAFAP